MPKNPHLITGLVLGGITLAGIAIGAATWRNPPVETSFTLEGQPTIPYNLSQPDQIIKLPGELKEISGLCAWSNTEVFAIQDELGKVYRFDLVQKDITETINFGKDLDYEGITRHHDTIYVLESDGDIHTFIYQQGDRKYNAKKLETIFKEGHDTEAICYDAFFHQLLIAPKEGQIGNLKGQKNYKGIFPFSLDEEKMGEAAYAIDLKALGQLLFQDDKRYTIKPSGMAIHPTSGHLYVVSSFGHLLVVVDQNNKLVHVELLEEQLLPQPEGLTFLPDNSLLISSEGKGGRGVILKFQQR